MSLLQLPENPPAVVPILEDDYDRLKAVYPDVGRAATRCVTCHGTRQFFWRGGDGEPAAWECPCEDQFLLHLWLLNAGLDLRYQRLSWSDATGVDPKVVETISDYALNAQSYAGSGIGLVLHGLRGNGKTLISTLLLKQLMGAGFDGYFTTFQGLLDLFTSGWRSDEEKGWFDRRIRNAGVLVVDDMGREHEGRLKVAESTFDHVLRARVAADRPTILTSNKDLDELGAIYSLNALSLLQECSIVVPFNGEDYRPKAQQGRVEEARLGLTRPVVLS